MKLNKKILLATLLTSASVLAACGQQETEPQIDLTGTYEIKVWCSDTEGVSDEFKAEIRSFEKANPGVVIKDTVETVSEADSATQMLTDVDAGADIYCFAQDQFARLVQGGALGKLGKAAADKVKAENDGGSVGAVTSGDSLYAYPLTSDNGYFMYYDKSVIKDTSHLTSMEALIADCEAAGKKWSFEMETSAWYLASFFFATGCHSNWTTDDKGKFVSVDDDFNSDKGVIAARAMQKLVKSSSHNSSSGVADFSAATPSAIVVSGTWDYNNAVKALGDNLGVAELPSFKGTDNKTYHLGSFSGNKLVGVKPQVDTKKSAVAHKLAAWFTNAANQEKHFDVAAWGPSNKTAQALPKVQANPALAALLKQSQYAVPQGQIHGSWWDIAKVIGSELISAAETDAACKTVLENYKKKIDALFTIDPAVARAFTVIGSIASEGCNWDKDLPMTESPTNTWTSAAITLAEGDEFKCRQGKSWDVAFGNGGENFKVTAADAGLKKIQLVTTEGADGKLTGTVSLIAA